MVHDCPVWAKHRVEASASECDGTDATTLVAARVQAEVIPAGTIGGTRLDAILGSEALDQPDQTIRVMA